MAPKKGASATPGPRTVRNTRPALNNGINSSYGSRGVAELGAQMTTGRASETYTHFQRTTRSQSTRPEPTPVVESFSSSSSATSQSPRPATAITLEAGYDTSRLQRAPAASPRAASAAPAARPAESVPVAVEPPGRWAVLFYTLPRYIARLLSDADWTLLQNLAGVVFSFFLLACVGFTLLVLFGVAPIPRSLTLRWNHLLRGVHLATGPIEILNPAYNATEHNRLMFWRTDDMLKATDALKTQVGFHDESIAELRGILPDYLAVKMDENGQYLVPEPFWKALLDKIGNDGAAPLWDSFIAANEDKLLAKLYELSHHDIPEDVNTSKDADHIISRFNFESTLAANNKMHEDEMRLQFNNFKELVMYEAKKMVDEGVTATFQTAQNMLSESVPFKISTQQISALSLTNLVYNRYKLMNEVNYFSPGMGALVDPHYTSNTAGPNNKSWLGYFYMKLFEASMTPNPPVNALTGWDEGMQCWCAAHGTGDYAYAQLTVKLPQKIMPAQITIEHIPPKGTRDIAAAPREYVVWAQISDKADAASVRKLMLQDENYAEHVLPYCGKPPRGEKNWICILSRGDYFIHGDNNVQSRLLAGEGKVSTDRIAVRVLRNWGATDHTCLYRVRVTGIHSFTGKVVEDWS